ncbi:unnamed protein product [Victoria cruziana]
MMIGITVMDKASKINSENMTKEEEVIDELLMEKARPISISENELDDYMDDDEQESQTTDASEESSWSLEPAEFMVESMIDLLADERNGKTKAKQFDGLREINREELSRFFSPITPDHAREIVHQMLEDPVNGAQMQDAVPPEMQQHDHVKVLLSKQRMMVEATSRLRTRNCQRPELEAISSSAEDAVATNIERQSSDCRLQRSSLNVGRRAQACAGEEKMKRQTWLPSISTELLKEIYSKRVAPTGISPVSSSIMEPRYVLPIWMRPTREWVKLNSCGMSKKVSTASASKVSLNDVESAACGGVIRNCNGYPLLSFVKQLDKVRPYTAKAMGVYHGVLMLFSLPEKVKSVWVECDSRVVVDLVSQNKLDGMAAFKLLQEFDRWMITSVEDRGNVLAEHIVAFGMSTGADFCIHDDLPPPLRPLLQLDLDIEEEFLRSNIFWR